MIKLGDRLPDGSFKVKHGDGTAEDLSVDDVFAGKKVVLVGVPGAFTSTCHHAHIPRFVENADAIKARGVETIAVMAVNDHHVMRVWRGVADPEGRLHFLADGAATYTKALGVEVDLSASGLGVRCQRFAMIADGGVVAYLAVEEATGQITGSSAAAVLAAL